MPILVVSKMYTLCMHVNFCETIFHVLPVTIDDRPFVPSGDSADEEETIDMEEESAAKVCRS